VAKQPFNLQSFRKKVAELKRAGLIKNVDARTAQPFFIRQGNTLKETVKKYGDLADDISSKKAAIVKLPPKKIKDLGYEKVKVGKDSFAVVPKTADEKISVEKGTVVITEKKGIQRIKTAVPFENLDKYLKRVKRNTKRIDAMKANNEWFAFKVYGRRSWQVFRSIDDLISQLQSYNSWQHTMNSRLNKQKELFEGLEILRVPDADKWHEEKESEVSKRKRQKQKYNKVVRKKWLKRIKGTPIDEHRKKSHREAQADYRERQKRKKSKPRKRKK
jgi:hypothetical protein